MATYVAMVRVTVEADSEEEARDLFMQASGLVSDSDLGMSVNLEDEVDFEEE